MTTYLYKKRSRMKRKLLFAISFLLCAALNAQNVSDLVISEVMADGDSSVVDEYGRRNGWIEIFNKSHGSVRYGGCFLTDDPENLTKSPIPEGDLRTVLGPRQTVLFYASGERGGGAYHTSFKIKRGGTVYLVSNDGKTIIDEIKVPDNLPRGKSVSKVAVDSKGVDFKIVEEASIPSPGMKNGTTEEESRSHKVAREDPYGWILTVVSISVVFFSLTLLWGIFGTLFNRQWKSKDKKQRIKLGDMPAEEAAAVALALSMEGDEGEYAAIAMALNLYLSDTVHDNESYIITIKPSVKSGWSDKTLNYRKSPR